jgi:hypothetical protein
MSKDPTTVTLPLGGRLRDSTQQATSMSLPIAVLHRLDLLRAAAADANATRAEIIGMLISEAGIEPDELESQILAYRKKTVGDVIPAKQDERPVEVERHNVVVLPVRRPGRPRNTAG